MMNTKILISDFEDPYTNLALEELIFRDESIKHNVILVYVNRPSVVVGRFQNPWHEVNLNFIKKNKIDLVRRFSGGGTVYHDRGNINFSFIGPKESYDKEKNFLFLKNIFKDLDLIVTDKNDVLCSGKKISGSAFKESRKRQYHHCTLLINSNLDYLRKSLKSQLEIELIKGVRSNPQSVMNLEEVTPIKTQEVIKKVKKMADQFDYSFNPDLLNEKRKKLISLRWIYEETPKFKIKLDKDSFIIIDKGIIIDSSSDFNNLKGQTLLNSKLL